MHNTLRLLSISAFLAGSLTSTGSALSGKREAAGSVPAIAAPEESRTTSPRSSGEYLGQEWHIDENHMMWWEGTPYIPFGGFAVVPEDPSGLKTHNLWIDFDACLDNPQYSREQHIRDIRDQLQRIADSGGTCIVQFSMAVPQIPGGPRVGLKWNAGEQVDASRLADPEVKAAILDVWAEFAPAVRNPCVRGLALWSEINWWQWPDHTSVDAYSRLLDEYVKAAKRLVGDVPVFFKTAGMCEGAETVITAAATVADGLGVDVWFRNATDEDSAATLGAARALLESRQTHTTWLLVTEGGKRMPDREDPEEYWDTWPPFASKAEALGILKAYVRTGIKGFIFSGPTADSKSVYHDSYRWLGMIDTEVTRLMRETQLPPASPDTRWRRAEPEMLRRESAHSESFSAGPIAAACADPRVAQLIGDVQTLHVTADKGADQETWLIRLFSNDRPLGFALVSNSGAVLSVGPPERGREQPPE